LREKQQNYFRNCPTTPNAVLNSCLRWELTFLQIRRNSKGVSPWFFAIDFFIRHKGVSPEWRLDVTASHFIFHG
jgi:hypothetical protein